MENSSHYIDLELFARIAEDDEEAFRTIYHSHNSRLYLSVLKLVKTEVEAQEIIQEVFLKLWLHRRTLTEIKTPVAWLHTIASNLSLTSLRKKAREQRRLKVVAGSDDYYTPEPGIDLDSKKLEQIIEEAVSRLPPSRRSVFILSRRKGLSRTEIASELNISESTVKNHLTSALKFIQDYIQKDKGLYLPVILLLLHC